METHHQLIFKSANQISKMDKNSVDLVVTSPPYPMIEMWDQTFSKQDDRIESDLITQNGNSAFEKMHKILDGIWKAVYGVMRPGGIAAINIGDATRTIGDNFSLYSNHSRILQNMRALGFSVLPAIIWRKQTNAPNKFMGSGMLPPGAYVTLEHEYILILRKGGKREFLKLADKKLRQQSTYFWEERNLWFSDVWMDLKGTRQLMSSKKNKSRERSGAFPFELAYRLINMFSIKKDTVLDPFLGTGTTTLAAMASGRNSMGYEIDGDFQSTIQEKIKEIVPFSNTLIEERLEAHNAFIKNRLEQNKTIKHKNIPYGFPVITNQEKNLFLSPLLSVKEESATHFAVHYKAE